MIRIVYIKTEVDQIVYSDHDAWFHSFVARGVLILILVSSLYWYWYIKNTWFANINLVPVLVQMSVMSPILVKVLLTNQYYI